MGKDLDKKLDSLSFGLNVPNPPNLDGSKNKPSQHHNIPAPDDSVDESKDSIDSMPKYDVNESLPDSSDDSESPVEESLPDDESGEEISEPSHANLDNKAIVAKECLQNGFIASQGRYEDDPFELLFLKVTSIPDLVL